MFDGYNCERGLPVRVHRAGICWLAYGGLGGRVDDIVDPHNVAHGLLGVEVVVTAAAGEQFVVGALFDDGAVVDD